MSIRRTILSLRLALLWLLALLLPLACGGGEPDLRPGTYRGQGVLLKLQQKGAAWTGGLEVGGKRFPVEGKLVGAELKGHFGKGEGKFPFVLKKEGKGYTLESEGNRYDLGLVVPKNPLAKPKPKPPANPLAKPKVPNPLAHGSKGTPGGKPEGKTVPKTAPNPLEAKPGKADPNPLVAKAGKKDPNPLEQDPGRTVSNPGGDKASKIAQPPASTLAGRVAISGKLYKHPLGFRFRYPDGWQLKAGEEDALLLLPPDLARSPAGIEEIIVVSGEKAAGITDVSDGRISGAMDQELSQILPFMRRKGTVKKLRIGGRDYGVHEWGGKNRNGKSFSGLAIACLLEGYSLGVIAIAPTDRLKTRRPVLEAIAGSIYYKEPERDKALVGIWRYESFYSSGTFGSTTIRVLELRGDGTSVWRSRLLLSMEHKNNYGDPTGSTTGDTGKDKGLKGRWYAQNKKLVLQWANGNTEEYSYYQEKGSMLMTPKGSKRRQLWKKIR
ncbi:MAG TPA: hypothetical protein ENK02_11110 [Planctomycetes bacterium]|nr:hypothetical protein [Planctomycetota bacterium]